jgi:putative transposase
METHLRTELVLQALNMAVSQRRPTQVIHHSDHGCQYTSVAFGKRCERAGVLISLGSVGDCYDNALAESFFGTLEAELLNRHTFHNPKEARPIIFDYIEGWYNPHRRHSSLGYHSPASFERAYAGVTEVNDSSAAAEGEIILPGGAKTPGYAGLSAEPVLLPRVAGEVLLTPWGEERVKPK